MTRVRVMTAMAYDLETYEDEGYADPRIRMIGELPGVTQAFEIARVYKGAQGRHEEAIAIADADGRVIWEAPPRVIGLRGEMFEDLFRTTVRERIDIESVREHTLLVYLDGALLARVPVFIDAPHSLAGADAFEEAAEAALKKSALCWITIPQPDGGALTRPAWYVQQGRSIFVFKGGTEQSLPGLEFTDRVTLIVKSKDVKATIGTTEADVRLVTDDEEFERIAGIGMGARLNLPDGEHALQRWKETCVLAELTPRPAA